MYHIELAILWYPVYHTGMQEGERRSAKLPPVRLTEEELGRWRAEATRRGVKLSEYVRWAVNGAQTGGRTQPEIPAEARAVKKETKVEKKSSAKKPKVQPEAPAAGLQLEDPRSEAVRVQTHDAEPDDQRSHATPDHTPTIAALKQNIKGLTTGSELAGNSRLPLKEKNSRAMLAALGLSQPQEVVIESEVLPTEHREAAERPDQPEVPPAASQRPATRKLPAVSSQPPTVVDDHGPTTATRDWGDILPIGNPRAEAAAKEKRRNVEAFNNSRRRLV